MKYISQDRKEKRKKNFKINLEKTFEKFDCRIKREENSKQYRQI